MPKITDVKSVKSNIFDLIEITGVKLNYDPNTLIDSWFSLLEKLQRSDGRRRSINILKSLYNESVYYSLTGRTRVSSPLWLKRFPKDGFPKILKDFRLPLRGSKHDKLIALTVLRSFEAFRCAPVVDFSTIENPSKGEENWIRGDFHNMFDKFMRCNKFTLKTKHKFNKYMEERIEKNKSNHIYHFSIRNGPYGRAFFNLRKDSLAIRQWDKYDKLLELARILGLTTFEETINLSCVEETKGPTHIGKLVFIPDKGCKTRVVAMGNYWIQEVLYHIHKVMYKVLKGLPTDGTYDQQSAAKAVMLNSHHRPIWSFDLTAATDRIPLIVQRQIMEFLDPNIGSLWGDIMENFPYYHSKRDDPVTYAVGQGMGLYSSWSNLAFFNHYIVQFSNTLLCRKVKINLPVVMKTSSNDLINPNLTQLIAKTSSNHYTTEYRVLGDDIAIWNRQVALAYRELISSVLDISISEQKSFTPERDDGYPFIAEFAKRIFHNGEEVTPIPPEVLDNGIRHPVDMPNLIDYLSKTSILSRDSVPCQTIVKVLQRKGYSPLRIDPILCLFHLRSLQGLHLPISYKVVKEKELNDPVYRIAFDPRKIDLDKLIELRLVKLEEQLSKHISAWKGETLTKVLGHPVPENSIWDVTTKQRIDKIQDLVYRIDMIMDDIYINQILPEQNEILEEDEYLPNVTVEDMLHTGAPLLNPQRARRKLYLFAKILVQRTQPKGGDVVYLPSE